MFLPLRASQGPLHAHVDEARRVLWQEFRQNNPADDQSALDRLDTGCVAAAFAQFLSTRPAVSDDVWAAQTAIWRLFDAGLIDDGSATVALLAIHVGLRRRTVRH